MLSLIIFMYNEERYIVETLESIKYQLENFGENIELQLILADDCSSDRTVHLADIWLDENEGLFTEVVKLYSPQNQGTCKKYAEAMRTMKGERFVSISGDDLFSAQNLFEKLERCQSADITMNAVLCFDENGIIENEKRYNDVTLQALVTRKSIHWESKLGSPVLNGAVYRKGIMSESVAKYIEMFKLVDDRPRVYKLAKENPALSVAYENSPILLSRTHNRSVSNLNSPHLKTHNDDLEKMYEDMLQDEKNVFMKIAIKRQKANVKYRGQKGIKTKLRYFSPYYIMLGMKMFFNSGKMKRLKRELLDNYVDVNREHLVSMKKRANEFYEKHNIIWDK